MSTAITWNFRLSTERVSLQYISSSDPLSDIHVLDVKRMAGRNHMSTLYVFDFHWSSYDSWHIFQFQQSNGWSFRATVSRINKKTTQRESVRLEPHPPYLKTSSLEARHWGATYALYRVRPLLHICAQHP